MQDIKIDNLPYIIFDFDGTLADTLALLIEAIKDTANNYGYNNFDLTQLNTEYIKKHSIKDLIKNYKVSLLKFPFIVSSIYKYISDKNDLIKPFLGIIDLIQALKANNFKLSIITSNNKKNVELFLKKNNLSYAFDSIYSESSIFGKDKVINKFLNEHNLNKDNIIYIGDEVRDIVAAKRAKIKIIAVSWGLSESKLHEEYDPDFIAYCPEDILKFLKLYLKK